MTEWVCICGQAWQSQKHKNAMTLQGIDSHWRGSPALLVPYRQWIREKLPGGRQGFVCCGDDGFIRCFNPHERGDLGELVAMEWKTFGRSLDHATRNALAAVECGRVRGTLVITLHGGNVPGQLAHYPVARWISGSDHALDLLPEQPEVAQRIVLNDNYTRLNEEVTEDGLIEAMKNAAGFVDPTRRCRGSGMFAGRLLVKRSMSPEAQCADCGQVVAVLAALDGGPDGVLDDHEVA